MAGRMVSMEVRLAIAAFHLVDDGHASVAEVCRNLGVSRDTYYRYRRRFDVEGAAGLLPRSTRPMGSPHQTSDPVMELVIGTRRELVAQGWDAGARSIHARLSRQGVEGLPSPRTVHRVLVRAGVIEAEPAKRPRSSFKRFEHARPNGCWQIDGSGWHLADGTLVCILRLIDDHSRMILATRAAPAETTADSWACVEDAVARHGAPAMLLSDGGSAFTGRRRGTRSTMSDFEARLRALGINPVVSSPFHPQTCGKKERDWQPMKKWLAAQPAATDLAGLQRLLDAYDVLFNTERPHQGIGLQTPADRYAATPKAAPADHPVPAPCTITHPRVLDGGRVHLGNDYRLCIGRDWIGQHVTVVRDDLDVVILNGSTIITRHRIDPTRKDQISGRSRGRTGPRPKPPVTSDTS
jgi:transposase InsO family protein